MSKIKDTFKNIISPPKPPPPPPPLLPPAPAPAPPPLPPPESEAAPEITLPPPQIITLPAPSAAEAPALKRMPRKTDPDVLAAGQRARAAAMRRKGRLSTILTDQSRETVGSTSRKLGGG